MSPPFSPVAIRAALLRFRPLLAYAVAWTALLAVTVGVVSLAPEIAFLWSARHSRACGEGSVRIQLEGPRWEAACVPAELFGRSWLDLVVSLVFAAVVVAGSACFVRAVGLWEAEEESAA